MAESRIMVVEDEGIVALDIQSKLESKGYEVPAVVSSGEEAVRQAEATSPDLVLMDIQLEGEMDGIQAAEQIRHRFDIPVVYLTAYSDDSTLQRAKIAEPFGYLLKPFEERELHSTIEIALYKHGMEQEKTRLEGQLRQSQTMEAVGQLTAGVAYNFNTMLQGILGNLDLALMSAPDELKPFLEAADFDAQRAAKMVQQLMLFYQQEDFEQEEVDIGATFEKAAETCRDIFSRKSAQQIAMTLERETPLPSVLGNEAQLRQCLVNICINAQEALAELRPGDAREPRIACTIASASFAPDDPLPSPGAAPGHYIRIDIKDNGIGMDDEVRERVFEPFFSTKQAGPGTGLGSTIVYALTRAHHGWVECASTSGEGTTISLYLPIADQLPETDEVAQTETITLSAVESEPLDSALFMDIGGDIDPEELYGTETVLVIADIDRTRIITTEMLERHDYSVLVGIDAKDGLNIYEHEKDALALVVLDLSASDAANRETLSALLAINPGAQVLVVTGYATDADDLGGAAGVLIKPFKTDLLLRKVRDLLDA